MGDLGFASELGNYAEYSGAPNEEEVLQYARVVIDVRIFLFATSACGSYPSFHAYTSFFITALHVSVFSSRLIHCSICQHLSIFKV